MKLLWAKCPSVAYLEGRPKSRFYDSLKYPSLRKKLRGGYSTLILMTV